MTEWSLIDTAPNDGTLVDLWVGGKRVPDCAWCGAWPGAWCYMGDPDYPQGRLLLGEPTHWMLRPSAPDRRKRAVLAIQQYAMDEAGGELWLGDEPLDVVHVHAMKIVEIVEGVLAGKEYVRVGDDENWEWVLQEPEK